MRKQITSLALLESGAIIISILPNKVEHTFIVNSVYLNEKDSSTELKLIEVNQYFTTWGMTLPTGCNKEKKFVSKNDSDYNFEFFDTGKTAKELSTVLLEYIKAEE